MYLVSPSSTHGTIGTELLQANIFIHFLTQKEGRMARTAAEEQRQPESNSARLPTN